MVGAVGSRLATTLLVAGLYSTRNKYFYGLPVLATCLCVCFNACKARTMQEKSLRCT